MELEGRFGKEFPDWFCFVAFYTSNLDIKEVWKMTTTVRTNKQKEKPLPSGYRKQKRVNQHRILLPKTLPFPSQFRQRTQKKLHLSPSWSPSCTKDRRLKVEPSLLSSPWTHEVPSSPNLVLWTQKLWAETYYPCILTLHWSSGTLLPTNTDIHHDQVDHSRNARQNLNLCNQPY